MEKVMHRLHDYWEQRSEGFSAYNRQELSDERAGKWQALLLAQIRSAFPDRAPETLRILDAGTGPGFFPVLLARAGYSVTAMDFSGEMLALAAENAGDLKEKITFVQGDVQNTGLPDMSFDVIVSRDVTWNLPHPEAAYRDWFRLLDEGGLLLNFDAAWYRYLADEEKKAAYEADRVRAEEAGIEDPNIGENFEVCERLAEEVPLTHAERPAWDLRSLNEAGFDEVLCDEGVWEAVWSEEEKISLASTPLFMIEARKKDIKRRVVSYWSRRSSSFLDQRRDELKNPIADRWLKEIEPQLPRRQGMKILDIGCGTGFFTILLSREGYDVTGIDLTPDMVADARALAEEEGVSCSFHCMDAEAPDFPDESFDAIVTRNLTWTLPHPKEAYRQWLRVLNPGGVFINFDANYGASAAESQEDLPYEHAHNRLSHATLAENDAIMRQLPISSHRRPAWDAEALEDLGVSSLTIDYRLSGRVFLEKDEFFNPVPMFRLTAVK